MNPEEFPQFVVLLVLLLLILGVIYKQIKRCKKEDIEKRV